jgi:hypothetical protein
MEAIEMKPERFHELCDQFRSPHLWANEAGKWRLRHQVKGLSEDQTAERVARGS